MFDSDFVSTDQVDVLDHRSGQFNLEEGLGGVVQVEPDLAIVIFIQIVGADRRVRPQPGIELAVSVVRRCEIIAVVLMRIECAIQVRVFTLDDARIESTHEKQFVEARERTVQYGVRFREQIVILLLGALRARDIVLVHEIQ